MRKDLYDALCRIEQETGGRVLYIAAPASSWDGAVSMKLTVALRHDQTLYDENAAVSDVLRVTEEETERRAVHLPGFKVPSQLWSAELTNRNPYPWMEESKENRLLGPGQLLWARQEVLRARAEVLDNPVCGHQHIRWSFDQARTAIDTASAHIGSDYSSAPLAQWKKRKALAEIRIAVDTLSESTTPGSLDWRVDAVKDLMDVGKALAALIDNPAKTGEILVDPTRLGAVSTTLQAEIDRLPRGNTVEGLDRLFRKHVATNLVENIRRSGLPALKDLDPETLHVRDTVSDKLPRVRPRAVLGNTALQLFVDRANGATKKDVAAYYQLTDYDADQIVRKVEQYLLGYVIEQKLAEQFGFTPQEAEQAIKLRRSISLGRIVEHAARAFKPFTGLRSPLGRWIDGYTHSLCVVKPRSFATAPHWIQTKALPEGTRVDGLGWSPGGNYVPFASLQELPSKRVELTIPGWRWNNRALPDGGLSSDGPKALFKSRRHATAAAAQVHEFAVQQMGFGMPESDTLQVPRALLNPQNAFRL